MSAINKLFLLGAIVAMVSGVVAFTMGDSLAVVLGIACLVGGLLLLISGYITPVVSESQTGKLLGIILLLGAVTLMGGVFAYQAGIWSISPFLLFGGIAILGLGCIAWPCICCSGSKNARSQVIGVASAHERMTVAELSRITSVPEKHARDVVYDAIGKRELSGRMEGDTFIRSTPTAPTYSSDAKVLVICPYCGAKTEQGLAKCQKCSAAL